VEHLLVELVQFDGRRLDKGSGHRADAVVGDLAGAGPQPVEHRRRNASEVLQLKRHYNVASILVERLVTGCTRASTRTTSPRTSARASRTSRTRASARSAAAAYRAARIAAVGPATAPSTARTMLP